VEAEATANEAQATLRLCPADAGIIREARTAYLDSECRMDSEWAGGWTLCTHASAIHGVIWA